MSTEAISTAPTEVGFPESYIQNIPNPLKSSLKFHRKLEEDLGIYSTPLKQDQYALINEGRRAFSIFSRFKRGEGILLPCADLRVGLRDTLTLEQLKKVLIIEEKYFLHLFWQMVSKAVNVEMPKDLKLMDVEDNFENWLEDNKDGITKIEKLEFEGSIIRKLPPQIGKLVGLKELIFHSGMLEEIPPEIGELNELEALHIRANPIRKLPQEMSNLTKLKKIVVWDCHELKEIHSSLLELPNLEHFQATDSGLKEIPKFASTALKVLLLNGNPCHLGVEHVALGGCRICKFPEQGWRESIQVSYDSIHL